MKLWQLLRVGSLICCVVAGAWLGTQIVVITARHFTTIIKVSDIAWAIVTGGSVGLVAWIMAYALWFNHKGT